MELELGLGLPSIGCKGRGLDFDLNNAPTKELSCRSKKRGFVEGLVGWPPVKRVKKKSGCGGGGFVGWPPLKPMRGRNSGNGSKKLVKVKKEGGALWRKVDLALHDSYHSLLCTLDDMFGTLDVEESTKKHVADLAKPNNDHASAVAYEDGDGDWMLVGDVPWETFMDSAKRLKIMNNNCMGFATSN